MIEFDHRPLTQAPKRLADALFRRFGGTMRTFGNEFVRDHRARYLSGSGDAEDVLNIRSGNLLKGFGPRVTGSSLRSLTLEVANRNPSAAAYVAVHEFGTVGAGGTLPDIVPKSARWLTIAMDPAKDERGTGRPARSFGEGFLTPMFLTESRDGWHFGWSDGDTDRQFLVRLDGKTITPYYRLVKRVAIRPRLHLRAFWARRIPTLVDRLGEDTLIVVREVYAPRGAA